MDEQHEVARLHGQHLSDPAYAVHRAPGKRVEPFAPEFTPKALGEMAAGRTAPLKSFLLDQSRIAGVGNIYADEALFRAELHPLSPAGSMRAEHLKALRDAVVAALGAGIDAGGSSIDDYRDARGEKGTMQNEFLVHTREGEDCPRCGTTIEAVHFKDYVMCYCPEEQTGGRVLKDRRLSKLLK